MCIIGIIGAIFAIKFYGVTMLTNGFLGNVRLGDEIVGINTYGMFFAIFAIFAFWRIYTCHNLKTLNTLLFCIFTFLASTSGSRKAIIGIVMGVALVMLLLSKQQRVLVVCKIVVGIGITFFILSSFNISEGIFERISTIWIDTNSAVADSDATRQLMIVTALNGWLEHPFFGNGFNSFTGNNIFGTYSHCNYAELLYNIGGIGTLAFYIPKLIVLKQAIKVIKTDDSCLSAFFITIMLLLLCFDIACISYYDSLLSFVWWFAAAHISNLCRSNMETSYEKSSINL